MNRKSPKHKNSNKAKIAIPLILILIIAVSIAAYYILHPKVTDSTPETTETSETSDEPAVEPLGPTESSTNKRPTQYEGEDPNLSPDYTGAITHLSTDNGQLNILVLIDQFVATGTCTLKLTQGTAEKTYEAHIIANPSSASCEGFTVPISELGSGHWQITITIQSDEKSGTITGEVEL